MKSFFLFLCSFFLALQVLAKSKTIHVYVALCDNENQGIVRVLESLGNGQSPRTNLYWGALYGVKTYFSKKSDDWVFIKSIPLSEGSNILERILFKHASEDVFLLADAYNGAKIKECTIDFLKASNHQLPITITEGTQKLYFGGKADLLAYVGHDGLMEFDVAINFQTLEPSLKPKEVIILACYSRDFFSPQGKLAEAKPLLWTSHLMAPEAYTLEAAFEGWILNESDAQIEERAAQSYHKYQKCGIKGARNLFVSGF